MHVNQQPQGRGEREVLPEIVAAAEANDNEQRGSHRHGEVEAPVCQAALAGGDQGQGEGRHRSSQTG